MTETKTNPYESNVINTYDTMASYYDDLFARGALRVLREIVHRTLFDTIKIDNAYILDAGGGSGALGLALAQKGHFVTVVDLSKSMLDIGKSKADSSELIGSINFVQTNLENMSSFENDIYDYIICEGSVLSFTKHPELILKEFYRLLKPNGKALISVQNRMFFMWLSTSLPVIKSVWKTGRVYPQINAGADYKCSSHSYMPDEFSELIKKGGFELLNLSSRFMVANRLGVDESRIDVDEKFFNEVVDFEMALSRKKDFLNSGRILTALCEKTRTRM
jgi:ubiquinone/menaquinone biosynthesis C-methylase UbiE